MPSAVMKIVGGFVLYYFHFTCVLLIFLVDKFSHLNHIAQQLTRFSMSTIPSTHTQYNSNTLKCIGMSMNG